MPGKDGTGPIGMGPRSGRGYGRCAGYLVVPMPAALNPKPVTSDNPGMKEMIELKAQVKIISDQLEQIKKHMKNNEV